MTSDVLRPLRCYASLLAGAALCLALPAFADAATWSGAAVRPKPERFILSSDKQHLYRYSFVVRQGVARSAPRKTAAVVRSLSRWTPEGTTNLVLTLDGRRTSRGVWIRVGLATLPNGRTGWVQRSMLSDWKEVGRGSSSIDGA